MTLALEYRPRTFSDLVGQRPVRVVLEAMVGKGKVPPALLFSGVRGTGKTTTARILAAALNCSGEGAPCGVCPSCFAVARGVSSDVIEVDAASNGLVADIRRLNETVLYATGGEWRVVLLDEAHSMSREAFNALLKTLEEPPEQTVFVLLTTEPGRILETVVSRCMTFEFRKIPAAEIVERLRFITSDAGLEACDDDLLSEIAERADGGLRDAIMLLDQLSQVGITTLEAYLEFVGDTDPAPRILKALLGGDVTGAWAIVDDAVSRTGSASEVASSLGSLCRDLLVIHAGGDCRKTGGRLAARIELAKRLDAGQVFQVVRVLWDLKTKIRPDDQAVGLELAVALIREALLGTTVSAAPARAAERMTLDQLRSRSTASV